MTATKLVKPFFILLFMVVAIPGIFADSVVYDQHYLNATIIALVQANGAVTKIDAVTDHSSFWIEFVSGLQVQISCDNGRHYYSRLNTCVDASKMILIYDKCQLLKEPDCWNNMPFCFFDSRRGTYRDDNCLPYFQRNGKRCQCELAYRSHDTL